MMTDFRAAAHQVGSSTFSRFKAALKYVDLHQARFAIGGEPSSSLKPVKDLYNGWIESIANTITDTVTGLSPVRVVRLVENESGELSVESEAGSASIAAGDEHAPVVADHTSSASGVPSSAAMSGCHVELVLRAERFLLQPLELPARATEFLEGIVRSQIDRLTPWSAEQAAYGWSEPVPQEDDRIIITVAAASKDTVTPFIHTLERYEPRSVSIYTETQDSEGQALIAVFNDRIRAHVDTARMRCVLNRTLLVMTIVTTLFLCASTFIGGYIEARQAEIALKVGTARGKLSKDGNPNLTHLQMLEQRKFDVAPTVLVMDNLSQVLPDDAYLTNLQIDGSKMRIAGVARNAAALIELMERSKHFSRATFTAPATRLPSEPGERFQIEAQIQPTGTASPL